MPAKREAPAKKLGAEAEAAVKEAESNGHRTIEVRGQQFELPDPVPFSTLLAVRSLYKAEDQTELVVAQMDLAEAYVGRQIDRLYATATDAQDGIRAVEELLTAIDEELGTDQGESEASSDS